MPRCLNVAANVRAESDRQEHCRSRIWIVGGMLHSELGTKEFYSFVPRVLPHIS